MTKTTIKKLEQLKKELKKVVKGRDKLIDALVLGIASNQHVLLIGKHGEAKSYLVENLAKATGLNYFASQIHQETIVKDIVGLLNPVKYREGEIDILKTKFWNSEILFFDEFLRGRSEFLDFLLEVMVERKTSKTLLGETKLPVISVIATSNPLTEEYNTERMDLALKDRFFAIISIDHLIADEANANTIHDILLDNATEVENVGLTRDELISFSEQAKQVNIDVDAVIEIFVNAYRDNFAFSTRFIKMFKHVCQCNALLHGRNEVTKDDFFEIGRLMILNRYEKLDEAKIENYVDEALIKKEFQSTVTKLREIDQILNNDDEDAVAVSLEKAVELIDETKDTYQTMPKRLRDKIDRLITNVEDAIRLNIDNPNIVTHELITKLDTERFKHIISSFINSRKIETKYLNYSDYRKIRKILSSIKYCEIKREKKMKYMKIKIYPKIDEAKSFKELENIKEILKGHNIYSAY